MEQLQMEQKLNVLCICIFVLVKDSIGNGLKVLINSNKKQAFHCGGDKKRSELYVLKLGPQKKKKNSYFQSPFQIVWLFVG